MLRNTFNHRAQVAELEKQFGEEIGFILSLLMIVVFLAVVV